MNIGGDTVQAIEVRVLSATGKCKRMDSGVNSKGIKLPYVMGRLGWSYPRLNQWLEHQQEPGIFYPSPSPPLAHSPFLCRLAPHGGKWLR